MHRISLRDSIRRLLGRQNRSASDNSASTSSGWNRVVNITADELEPGVVMIAIRESEEHSWTEVAVGSADVEPIVRSLLEEGEKAKQTLRDAYGHSE